MSDGRSETVNGTGPRTTSHGQRVRSGRKPSRFYPTTFSSLSWIWPRCLQAGHPVGRPSPATLAVVSRALVFLGFGSAFFFGGFFRLGLPLAIDVGLFHFQLRTRNAQ